MTYIDPAVNYEQTAEFWARHLDQPFHSHGRAFELDMDLLQTYSGIYPETIEYIEIDPVAFATRVASYRHGLHSGVQS